jgi:hypothetical protein
MPIKDPLIRLSREEEMFLRCWIYDEAHYQEGVGPAKWLQLQHRVPPAELATLIAAAIPDLTDQEAAGLGPPPAEPAMWPWSEESQRSRLLEARDILTRRRPSQPGKAEVRPTEAANDSTS